MHRCLTKGRALDVVVSDVLVVEVSVGRDGAHVRGLRNHGGHVGQAVPDVPTAATEGFLHPATCTAHVLPRKEGGGGLVRVTSTNGECKRMVKRVARN